MKILESSQTLLHVLKRETVNLTKCAQCRVVKRGLPLRCRKGDRCLLFLSGWRNISNVLTWQNLWNDWTPWWNKMKQDETTLEMRWFGDSIYKYGDLYILLHDKTMLTKQSFFGMHILNPSWSGAVTPTACRWDVGIWRSTFPVWVKPIYEREIL